MRHPTSHDVAKQEGQTLTPPWLPWLQATQGILWIAAMFYTWFSNQRRADRNQVKAIEAANNLLEHKVLLLEEQVKHLPCETQWLELHSDVSVVKERTANLNGWLETVAKRLDRIDDWLRENK